MQKRPISFVLILTASLTVGCGDGGNGGSTGGDGGAGPDGAAQDGGNTDAGGGDQVSLAEYCEAGSNRYFDYLQNCFGEVPYPESYREEFVTRIRERCLTAQGAVDGSRLSYDPEAAARCVEVLQTDDCIAPFRPSSCDDVFTALVDDGDDCYVEEGLVFLVGTNPCASGRCVENGMCPGSCVPYPERGRPCGDGVCAPEDHCSSGEQVCRADKALGATCNHDGECEGEAACVGDPPRCTTLVQTAFEPCDSDDVCPRPSLCIDDRCRFHVELGERCRVGEQCPDGALCLSTDGDPIGVCSLPRALGEDCNRDRDCASGLCVTGGEPIGACAQQPGTDEPCAEGACAEGNSCRYGADDGAGGTCRALLSAGDECLVDGTRDAARCAADLFCTAQGTCEAAGDRNDPCDPFDGASCNGGLWCSRATGVCTPPADDGDLCNPLWTNTCADGLACRCELNDRDLCAQTSPTAQDHDKCGPARSEGQTCYRYQECTTGECLLDPEAPSDAPGECVDPDAAQCLP